MDYLSNIPGSGRVRYKDGTYMDIRFSPERYDMMRHAQKKPGWRPNKNMPKEAARILLQVKNVWAERVQDHNPWMWVIELELYRSQCQKDSTMETLY